MTDQPNISLQDQKKTLEKKKPLVLGIVVGLLLLFVLITLLSTSRKEKATIPSKEQAVEKRSVYSKTEIENLIKGQIAEEIQKSEVKKPKEVAVAQSRKLGSPIAVYIKKDENRNSPREGGSRQNKELGITTGTKIKAHLANAIFSFNVSSPVVAVVDEDVMKDTKVVIPKGTQFIGDAGIVKSRDRVNVQFMVMVLPDGKEIKLRAMALSLDGSGGIIGRVDKQVDKSFLKAAGEVLLSGAALVVGTSNQALSLQDELRLNAARNLTQDAQGALNNVRVEESVTVQAYTPILVLILESF